MGEVGTGTAGTRFLNSEWPLTEGLTAGTTKQEGTTAQLEAEEADYSEHWGSI